MNPVKGETPLKLADGREFVLVVDHEALVLASEAFGQGMASMLARLMPPEDEDGNVIGEPSYAALRAFLYGALNANHPHLTLRDASQVLLDNFKAVVEAIGKAADRAFPERKAKAGKQGSRPPRARSGRGGKNSGGSGAKRASTPKGSGAPRRARSS